MPWTPIRKQERPPRPTPMRPSRINPLKPPKLMDAPSLGTSPVQIIGPTGPILENPNELGRFRGPLLTLNPANGPPTGPPKGPPITRIEPGGPIGPVPGEVEAATDCQVSHESSPMG
jgi:hypothetical protein